MGFDLTVHVEIFEVLHLRVCFPGDEQTGVAGEGVLLHLLQHLFQPHSLPNGAVLVLIPWRLGRLCID